MEKLKDRVGAESNVVPVPDPAKSLHPVYLMAHALVDQIPSGWLASLLPFLERVARGDSKSLPALPVPCPRSLPPAERTDSPPAGTGPGHDATLMT